MLHSCVWVHESPSFNSVFGLHHLCHKMSVSLAADCSAVFASSSLTASVFWRTMDVPDLFPLKPSPWGRWERGVTVTPRAGQRNNGGETRLRAPWSWEGSLSHCHAIHFYRVFSLIFQEVQGPFISARRTNHVITDRYDLCGDLVLLALGFLCQLPVSTS